VQTGCETIAQKAIAGGIDGHQVNGNDVLAVYYVVSQALEKARQNQGASVIEAITYRLCDHTTADDASRYRPDTELQIAWQNEPITRLKKLLTKHYQWKESDEDALQQDCYQQVEHAVKQYLATPRAPVSDMFDYLYANLPKQMEAQRETALYYGETDD